MVKKPKSKFVDLVAQSPEGGEPNESLVPPAPWERQEGESARAFSAFVVYRDLPPENRKIDAVRDQLYPQAPWAKDKLHRWAQEHHWQVRADAWMSKIDLERRQVQLETVRSMTARHIEAAIAMQLRGLSALRGLSNKADLTAAEIRMLITEGAKLERLSRGLATDRIGGKEKDGRSDDEGLSDLPDDELRRLEGVAKQAAEGAQPQTPH
jgi:hypothetical protein